MICFPNTKVNIGLNILSKRSDGYHDIETIFYPVPFYDILEILPSEDFELINEGIRIDCPVENNLCFKAYDLLLRNFKIGPVKIILYKNVPFGSGLGAGSSNAAHTLILLNKMFDLKIDNNELTDLASLIGADCAFFIKNRPVFATGIGNVFNDLNLDLRNKFIVICLPGVSVNTAAAYKNSVPSIPQKRIKDIINLPIKEWKYCLKNDFEDPVFDGYPDLIKIKNELYERGAEYAQMSGSGSAIFGIFDSIPEDFQLNSCKGIKIVRL